MKPSRKNPGIDNALTAIFGFSREDAIRSMKCVPAPIGCGKEINPEDFKDEISKREYTISGLCQACQDKVF